MRKVERLKDGLRAYSRSVASHEEGGAGTGGVGRVRRHGLGAELGLALPPTLTVLAVLALIEAFSRQRLMFASLASSAFLVYLDPRLPTNSIRTIVLSQTISAVVGLGALSLIGPGYVSAGVAMVVVIVLMIVFDVVHPPAVSTTLSFAFQRGPESSLLLFGLAVALIVVLVVLQRISLRLLERAEGKQPA